MWLEEVSSPIWQSYRWSSPCSWVIPPTLPCIAELQLTSSLDTVIAMTKALHSENQTIAMTTQGSKFASQTQGTSSSYLRCQTWTMTEAFKPIVLDMESDRKLQYYFSCSREDNLSSYSGSLNSCASSWSFWASYQEIRWLHGSSLGTFTRLVMLPLWSGKPVVRQQCRIHQLPLHRYLQLNSSPHRSCCQNQRIRTQKTTQQTRSEPARKAQYRTTVDRWSLLIPEIMENCWVWHLQPDWLTHNPHCHWTISCHCVHQSHVSCSHYLIMLLVLSGVFCTELYCWLEI